MILVEVGELVVEENGCAHVFGDGELQNTLIAFDLSTVVKGDVDILLFRPLRSDTAVGILKCRIDGTAGHICERAAEVGGIVDAVGVVELDLPNLCDMGIRCRTEGRRKQRAVSTAE